MEYIASAIFSGILYDGFCKGKTITTAFLKENLQGWIVDDTVIEQLVSQLKQLKLEELGQPVIDRKINASSETLELLKQIKFDQNIDSVNQIHSGSGDNVAGNKVINN